VSHASPRIIAHEHMPNVYDALWATSGSGVGFAIYIRGSTNTLVVVPLDMNSVTTNDYRQLECRVAAVVAYCDLGRRMFLGAPSRRL